MSRSTIAEKLARIVLTAATVGVLVGLGPPPASADTGNVEADTGRFDTPIGEWKPTILRTGERAISTTGGSPDSDIFTVPGPGLTGPITFASDDGTVFCLDVAQPLPFVALYWIPESEAMCQDVTTVIDPATGAAGFRAAGGPYDGRYLGDESEGGVVDWAQTSFFAVEVPALPITPPPPTLQTPTECGIEPTVLLPSATGLLYQQTRNGSTVEVTVSAVDGNELASGATSEWAFDVTPSPCPPPQEVEQTPEALQPAGDADTQTTARLADTGGQSMLAVVAVGALLVVGGVAIASRRQLTRRAR